MHAAIPDGRSADCVAGRLNGRRHEARKEGAAAPLHMYVWAVNDWKAETLQSDDARAVRSGGTKHWLTRTRRSRDEGTTLSIWIALYAGHVRPPGTDAGLWK